MRTCAQQRWQERADYKLETLFCHLTAGGHHKEAAILRDIGIELRQALGMEAKDAKGIE